MKNSGIVNVYKEKGYTSFDVVAILRKTFHIKKVGHTGTLDPDAEGVLPVCFGKATKVCDLLTDKDKVYRATMHLGITTDTEDMTGNVTSQREVTCTEDEIRRVMMEFVGDIMQVPPMYSALKVNGKKLYELAREGIEVERKARPIHIFSIEIEEIALPLVTFSVHCSKGTYIRTLCKDIGEKLGCGACMERLLRTRVSCFDLEHALKLEEIKERFEKCDMDDFIYDVDSIFSHTKKAVVKEDSYRYALNGAALLEHNFVSVFDAFEQEVTFLDLEGESSIRVYLEDGSFVGIYDCKDGICKLRKMFYES